MQPRRDQACELQGHKLVRTRPELELPAEMLASLAEGEERKDLLLDVSHNEIDVDI